MTAASSREAAGTEVAGTGSPAVGAISPPAATAMSPAASLEATSPASVAASIPASQPRSRTRSRSAGLARADWRDGSDDVSEANRRVRVRRSRRASELTPRELGVASAVVNDEGGVEPDPTIATAP